MRRKRNQLIRKEIQKSRLRYWEIAERMGIRGDKLTVLLRFPLDVEWRNKILAAIEDLRKEVR